MSNVTKFVVEDAALSWLESLGYTVLHGPDIAAGEPAAECSDSNCRDAVLKGRLHHVLVHLNPKVFAEARVGAHYDTLLPKLLGKDISRIW